MNRILLEYNIFIFWYLVLSQFILLIVSVGPWGVIVVASNGVLLNNKIPTCIRWQLIVFPFNTSFTYTLYKINSISLFYLYKSDICNVMLYTLCCKIIYSFYFIYRNVLVYRLMYKYIQITYTCSSTIQYRPIIIHNTPNDFHFHPHLRWLGYISVVYVSVYSMYVHQWF